LSWWKPYKFTYFIRFLEEDILKRGRDKGQRAPYGSARYINFLKKFSLSHALSKNTYTIVLKNRVYFVSTRWSIHFHVWRGNEKVSLCLWYNFI